MHSYSGLQAWNGLLMRGSGDVKSQEVGMKLKLWNCCPLNWDPVLNSVYMFGGWPRRPRFHDIRSGIAKGHFGNTAKGTVRLEFKKAFSFIQDMLGQQFNDTTLRCIDSQTRAMSTTRLHGLRLLLLLTCQAWWNVFRKAGPPQKKKKKNPTQKPWNVSVFRFKTSQSDFFHRYCSQLVTGLVPPLSP